MTYLIPSGSTKGIHKILDVLLKKTAGELEMDRRREVFFAYNQRYTPALLYEQSHVPKPDHPTRDHSTMIRIRIRRRLRTQKVTMKNARRRTSLLTGLRYGSRFVSVRVDNSNTQRLMYSREPGDRPSVKCYSF